jgi:hypothetical protein
MTEKQKQNIEPKVKSKQKGGYSKLFLLFGAVLVLGWYLLGEFYPSLFNDILHKEAKPQGDEIVKFAPDEVIEECSLDSKAENPYEKDVEPIVSNTENEAFHNEESAASHADVVSDSDLLNNLNDYRIYLANAQELVIKFYTDIDYSENLAIIKQLSLPQEVEEIISMLEAYNNMMRIPNDDSEKVLLFNTDIFEKFIKIRKETPADNEKKKLRMTLENKIWLLSGYIFSPEMQEAFLK